MGFNLAFKGLMLASAKNNKPTKLQTCCRRLLFAKLIVAQLVQTFLALFATHSILPCSQEPTLPVLSQMNPLHSTTWALPFHIFSVFLVTSSGFPPDNPCVSLHPCFMSNPSTCPSFDSYLYIIYITYIYIYILYIYAHILNLLLAHFSLLVANSSLSYAHNILWTLLPNILGPCYFLVMPDAKFTTWCRNNN